jgi:phosphoglucosamine mutase
MTNKRHFGTDGIRGIANSELTCKMAFALGAAAVELLGKRLVIGKDTRRSGDMLESAMIAGILSQGGTALLAGVIPTPAVALLIRQLGADGGSVISASHNAPEYNGIKFFDSQGYKLSKSLEDRFEQKLQNAVVGSEELTNLPTGVDIGQVELVADAAERYIQHAINTVTAQGLNLKGLTIAVDCGNGASYQTTPETLRRLGAKVEVINDEGNGDVINVESGSTNLKPLQELVLSIGADLGIAHDGDADRMIATTADGSEIDGDYIEAICALDLKAQGALPQNTIVSTVMCNLGFSRAMQEAGITVIQTSVGDANVLEAMRAGNYSLGGEQSGHMIFLEHNTTGDGLITALQLIVSMLRNQQTLAQLAQDAMQKYPQELINIKVTDKNGLDANQVIADAIAVAEAQLERSGGGRVLVRASGTEPLVRVMVESASEAEAHKQATTLAELVAAELG